MDVVKVGGAEVDAGAALQGGEEGGGHVGSEPAGHPVQLLTRHQAALVLHPWLFSFLFSDEFLRERERMPEWDGAGNLNFELVFVDVTDRYFLSVTQWMGYS